MGRDQEERNEQEILLSDDPEFQKSETHPCVPILKDDDDSEKKNKTLRCLLYIGLFFALWTFTSLKEHAIAWNEVLASQVRQNIRDHQRQQNEPEHTENETLDESIDRNGTDDYSNSSINANHTDGNKDDEDGNRREDPRHVLHSYTYSNCPFTMAKFSQYELGKEGPFKSDIDRLTNSIDRGKMALDFSNENNAYDRVVTALQDGSFDDRKIVLDGDSLTRQLFISLGCMAWAAGYVDKYEFDQNEVYTGGENTIMNNVHYEASSKIIDRGLVHLKGGGQIYYIGNPIKKKIERFTDTMVSMACNSDSNSATKKNKKHKKNKNNRKLPCLSQYQASKIQVVIE